MDRIAFAQLVILGRGSPHWQCAEQMRRPRGSALARRVHTKRDSVRPVEIVPRRAVFLDD